MCPIAKLAKHKTAGKQQKMCRLHRKLQIKMTLDAKPGKQYKIIFSKVKNKKTTEVMLNKLNC